MKLGVAFLASLVVLVCFSVAASAAAAAASPVADSGSDGDLCHVGGFNLEQIPLTNLTAPVMEDGVPDDTQYTWLFNLCGVGSRGIAQRSMQGTNKNTFFLKTSSNPKDRIVVMQLFTQATSSEDAKPFTLVLVCDATTELNFYDRGNYPIVAESNSYTSTMGTKYLCPASPKTGGCGGGCVFVILVFSSLGLYAIVVAVVSIATGDQYIDLNTHRAFWFDLPSLVADGFLFVLHKVQAIFGRAPPATATYEEV